MPKRGAAPAAAPADGRKVRESSAELAKEADGKPVQLDPEPEATPEPPADRPKPAQRGGRRKPAEPETLPDSPSDNGEGEPQFEDWTKPDYASNPGEFQFDNMDDGDEYLSILWWGREGTGKTTDLARVAATKLAGAVKGNVLLINAEAGAKRTALRHHGIDTSRIMLYPPRGEQLTFEGLERLFYRLQADMEKDPNSWGAVGWDSITAIYQKLLDDVIEADMRQQAEILQRAKKTRAGRSGNITLRDRFETDRDDYSAMTNQVRLLLRKYRTLPCHFLVTALERRDEDKNERKGTKKSQYGPAVSPALQTDLLGYVDVVIRTHVLDEGVYYGRTTPTEDSRGKDRMFALPVELVDPTFDRIHAYVHGELKEGTDRAQRRMPGGAEGIASRRSLAEGDEDEVPWLPDADAQVEVYHTKDGTPDGPPLEGDEDDPEPPKRRAASRRSRASSAEETATDSASETGSSAAEPEPPKRAPRKTAAERRAEREAKATVQADTDQKGGPATRRVNERTRKAKQAEEASKSGSGFADEPPF